MSTRGGGSCEQLAYWVRTKEGRTRETLQGWLRQLLDAMEGRVLGFSVAVAHVWAEQQRALDAAGLRMPLPDSYIAATVRRHGRVDRAGLRVSLAVVLEPAPLEAVQGWMSGSFEPHPGFLLDSANRMA